jgi:hypothetical protein
MKKTEIRLLLLLLDYFSPCTKINSKWIKDLNVRPETPKLLQENKEKTLEDIGIGTIFLHGTPIIRK